MVKESPLVELDFSYKPAQPRVNAYQIKRMKDLTPDPLLEEAFYEEVITVYPTIKDAFDWITSHAWEIYEADSTLSYKNFLNKQFEYIEFKIPNDEVNRIIILHLYNQPQIFKLTGFYDSYLFSLEFRMIDFLFKTVKGDFIVRYYSEQKGDNFTICPAEKVEAIDNLQRYPRSVKASEILNVKDKEMTLYDFMEKANGIWDLEAKGLLEIKPLIETY